MSNGFTIHDYLNKVKSENPQYSHYTKEMLYDELKSKGEEVPTWQGYEDRKTSWEKEKKAYQQRQNPDFVNQLYDWTDWGIDENSWRWAKAAYNNSITGLSYQLYNGEQRFDLENYNPGIGEDILSAVASFMMPADMLAMAGGGFLGGLAKSGVGTLAKEGLKGMLVKKYTSRNIRKELAERGFNFDYGARPLKNAFQKLIMRPLSHLTRNLSYLSTLDFFFL